MNKIIWLDFFRYYDKSITEEVADYLLWEKTAFPIYGLRMATYQIRQAIRIMNGTEKVCSFCGMVESYHKHKCIFK